MSTEPFWARPELVRSYPVGDRFLAGFGMIYDPGSRFELVSYPLREFHAIPLARFLDVAAAGKDRRRRLSRADERAPGEGLLAPERDRAV